MGLFDRLFKRTPEPQNTERVHVSGGGGTFTAWAGSAYENEVYRGAVDAIARNAGKLKGTHVIKYQGGQNLPSTSKINRLLQVQPNEYINSYDLIYRLVTHYFLHNNAFAYIARNDRGDIEAIYPLRVNAVQFLNDPLNRLFVELTLLNGKKHVLPYSDVIHIKRHMNDDDFLGDSNQAINQTLEVAHSQDEGIVNGIKNGVTIRGILQFNKILNADTLKEKRDAFMTDYLNMENNGGVAAIDNEGTYLPIENKPFQIDTTQIKAVQDKIYNYLGVTESIVNSSYNENEWAAFYESTIEPIALQLSLEFTRKLFTDREQAFGNSILFESGRMQFASNESKVRLLKEIVPMGLLTTNQALEILNLPTVDNGDRRIQSLNYIDQEIVNEYQMKGNNITPVDTGKEEEGKE